jgi:hypothetical protein
MAGWTYTWSTVTNVAGKAGVTNDPWGFSVAVGDYDNDGWPGIYVSNFGKNRLYHNNHDGTFTDVAEYWSSTGCIRSSSDVESGSVPGNQICDQDGG